MNEAAEPAPAFGPPAASDAALLDIEALSPDRILGRAAGENFPVALRVLPPRDRSALLAVYGFARLVDQAGDEAPGDRLALLDALERDLDRAFDGAPHPSAPRSARPGAGRSRSSAARPSAD